ncbi:acetyltransferase, partial [Lacticaseibacillus rhamnosus MTCC 5462]
MAVRPAMATDIPLLLPLVQGYYHDSPVPLTIDSQAMAVHLDRLRSDTSLGHLLVATVDQQLAGFAILYRSFETRALKPLLIINDVYVAPKFRRHGLARQLMMAAF